MLLLVLFSLWKYVFFKTKIQKHTILYIVAISQSMLLALHVLSVVSLLDGFICLIQDTVSHDAFIL